MRIPLRDLLITLALWALLIPPSATILPFALWSSLLLLLLAIGLALLGLRAGDGALVLPRAALLAGLLLASGWLLGSFPLRWPDSQLLALAQKLALLLVVAGSVTAFAGERGGRRLRGLFAAMGLLLAGNGVIGLIFDGPGRPLSGIFGHANVHATMLLAALPFVASWFGLRLRRLRWALGALLLLLLAALLLTRSAGALLAGALGWGSWLLLRAWLGQASGRVGGGRAPALLLTGLLLAAALAGAGWLKHVGEVASGQRAAIAAGGWNLWLQAPLTGSGVGSVPFLFPAARPLTMTGYPEMEMQQPLDHLHLQPLQMAVEGGVLALAGLALGLLLLLLGAWRGLQRDGSALAKGGALWIALVSLLLHGSISLSLSRAGALLIALLAGQALRRLMLPASAWLLRPLRMPPALAAALALLLLLALPLQLRRMAAGHNWVEGRDAQRWYAAADLSALDRALDYWPEHLPARALRAYEKARLARNRPPGPERDTLERAALSDFQALHQFAPQYLKIPLWRASLLLDRGEQARALQVLLRADRFVGRADYEALLEGSSKAQEPPR